MEVDMIIFPAKIGRADIRYATDADVSTIAATIDEQPSSEMVGWHFVRFEVGFDAEIHALGFMHGDVYITSPLRVFDGEHGLIRTRSGHIYQLACPADDDDLNPRLAYQIGRALIFWRYASAEEVRAV
jgi:hypothetical protein